MNTPKTMQRTTDQLCVRSASLRNIAVSDKENAGTLHDAADLLYDAAQELDYLRNSHDRLVKALETIGRCARNAMRDLASKPQPDHE